MAVLTACSEPASVSSSTTTSTFTASAVTPFTTSTSTTPPASLPADRAGERPATAVVALEDGRLVVADSSTGEVLRTLTTFSDLREPPPEGGHRAVVDIALGPDRTIAYLDICCEPAAGNVSRVRTNAPSEPEHVDMGYGPSASPDGAAVAFGVHRGGIGIHRAAETTFVLGSDDTVRYTATVWLDDDTVAYVRSRQDDGTLLVHELSDPDLRGDRTLVEPGITIVELARQADGSLLWVDADGGAHVVDPTTGTETASFDLGSRAPDIAYDVSGTWLLVCGEDGLRWFGGGTSGDILLDCVAAGW